MLLVVSESMMITLLFDLDSALIPLILATRHYPPGDKQDLTPDSSENTGKKVIPARLRFHDLVLKQDEQ